MKIPLLGLGTWELNGRECTETVHTALSMGYKHIDTAHMYNNHKAIGKALSDFNRRSFFITSKLEWDEVADNQIEKSVEKACDLALHELEIDYIDLYLLHWPDRSRPMTAVLKAMERLITQKKILQMGVSNFTIHHLQDALDAGIKMSANQVEFHPYLYQKDLLAFCQKHEIELIAYRPLGKKALLKEPLFTKIGKVHGKSAGQVILRWMVQRSIPVVPKASLKTHLKENLEIFDFTLTDDEMRIIDKLNRNERFCDPGDPEFDY